MVDIQPRATDCQFVHHAGIPGFGFSAMAKPPILLHDHDEFLNKGEYMKGIIVYEEIIKAYTSLSRVSRHGNGGSIQFYNCIGYSYCAILLNESLEGSDLIVLTGPLRMGISSHWLPISSNLVSVHLLLKS